MPELPDVEGFRRVASRATGRRVRRVHAPAPDVLRNTSPQGLGRAMAGRRVGAPRRHGKWLWLPVDGRSLLLHFGMTGALVWADPEHPPTGSVEHDRMVVDCDGAELRYRSMRKLGGVWLVRDGDEAAAVTGRQGPDAADLDTQTLAGALAGRRGALKPALMDQSVVAGLGNLTVDEVLWRAGVSPQAPAADLPPARVDTLTRAVREVLGDSVPVGRVPDDPGWLTGVRDDEDGRCPRCGTRLQRLRVAGRGTVCCPRCQPDP